MLAIEKLFQRMKNILRNMYVHISKILWVAYNVYFIYGINKFVNKIKNKMSNKIYMLSIKFLDI